MAIFTKKKSTKYIEPESYVGAKKDRGLLAKTAMPGAQERLGRAGETYPGPLTASLSEFEEKGLGGLGDYLDSPLPTETALHTGAVDEILKTLGGEYDPADSDYYKAYKTAVLRELEESKDRVAARTSAGDKFFGGGRIQTEGELEESAMGDMALVLGELAERERMNRLNVLGPALEYSQFGEQSQLQRVAASQTFGALPRLIEQAGMDREYMEWMRALNDLGISLDTATGLATYQPNLIAETKGGGQKGWVKDVGQIGSAIAGGVQGFAVGGPIGAIAGAAGSFAKK